MVIPVHDDNPTRRTPVVTYALLAVNIVVFLLSPLASHVVGDTSGAQQCRQIAFLEHWAAVPDELVHNRQEPVVETDQVAVGEDGQVACERAAPSYTKLPWLSVLTAMFLHGGWLHLLGNMLFLFVFGNNVEDRLGRLRFLGFYLLCGYAATYGFALFQPSSTQPLVGASGAIAGVLGAYLVLYPRARVLSLLTFLFFLPVRLPAWLVLGGWFALQYLYFRGAGVAEGSNVAYGAHVVGFVVGAALVWGLRNSAQHQPLRAPRWGPYA
ncbi:MAG TPA: rhomboid family intramembrane serine protease [Mycobacteriales bacterium]|nr:rhomboid family intramembrane serine protease [Mycobacteriales bacterium]